MNIREICGLLSRSIGESKVRTGKEVLLSYAYDATGIKSVPDIVVFPETDSDIGEILKIASTFRMPVTPRGGGVGYSGGSVPVQGGIVMAFSGMNRILEFDKENFLIVVEPGVTTGAVIDKCEANGFFYPPDPASLRNSTIGGNVAENAGGPRCFKYGVTSDYVLANEGYLMSGVKVKFGSRSLKDVSGYDIKRLIAGSEGTLLVLSKIVLRMIPKPEERALIRYGFKSLRDGAEFIKKIIGHNLAPSVLEFMDHSSLEAVYNYLGTEKPAGINSIVLVELDGTTREVVHKLKESRRLADESGIIDIQTADSERKAEELWRIRRNLSPAISVIKPKKINEDISVPIGKVAETIEYISGLSAEYNIPIVMFGHLGDGNIHTNLMVDPADEIGMRHSRVILEKIFTYVIGVNGTLSGEHGIGLTKKDYLNYQYGGIEIELFRKIKKVFDPENLLNPGKIF